MQELDLHNPRKFYKEVTHSNTGLQLLLPFPYHGQVGICTPLLGCLSVNHSSLTMSRTMPESNSYEIFQSTTNLLLCTKCCSTEM
uniref:Uncharacterized protein n=1 Tax=Physcomitrium patens TaxID=3218 RepID=A0A2K1K7P4_PHYPA|nr:hypothetical protein PHYPA_011695 [Physcomitrium patens]